MSTASPITPNSNYHGLISFALASLIFDAIVSLCDHLFNYQNDPLGKYRGQRIGAAQSAMANIAEGTARGGTSRETEVRLLDVARASLVELYAYCECDLRQRGITPWQADEQIATTLRKDPIEPFQCQGDIAYGFYHYMQDLDQRFQATLFSHDAGIALNSIMIICLRCIQLLRRQIETIVRQIVENGGFAERLSQARLEQRRTEAEHSADHPKCPLCGGAMIKRLAKHGANAGKTFWSCANYPECKGSRAINQP